MSKLAACSCVTFLNLKNNSLFDRPFGPQFSHFDPILHPKMASPDRLLALPLRLPTSISEFSKKIAPLTRENAIFASSAPSKKPIFLASKSCKNLCFSTCFWKRYFFKFLYQKYNFWAPTWAPTWRQKPTFFFIFRIKSPKNPMGTPKARQSLPWTPPGPSENLEDELLDVENLHFSAPKLLKTQKK